MNPLSGAAQKIAANAAWLVLALAASPAVRAQGLPDPTRPPAGFVDPADLKAGGAGTAVAGDAAEAGLVLQSVLLPQSGKPVAVISGHYVPLGARIEGWELTSVGERQVTLTQGAARRVLRLTPLVSKTMVDVRPASGSPKPARPPARKKAKAQESELKR